MATPVIFDYDANGGKYLFAFRGSATNPASRSRHQERDMFSSSGALANLCAGWRARSGAAGQTARELADCCREVA